MIGAAIRAGHAAGRRRRLAGAAIGTTFLTARRQTSKGQALLGGGPAAPAAIERRSAAASPYQVYASLLKIIDRYLLRQIITTCAVMTGVGLAILILERVLHLFGLVANPNKAFSYVGQMLVLLMPHYLSIALPAAFFFGILLTFGRLKRDSELVVMASSGRSLARLLAPVMSLAVVMMVMTAIIVGFLSPHARYAYRSLKDQVARASLTAAVLGGTFIHADGLTFFAEKAVPGDGGLHLAKVFVHQTEPDGKSIVVTGHNGLLGQSRARTSRSWSCRRGCVPRSHLTAAARTP